MKHIGITNNVLSSLIQPTSFYSSPYYGTIFLFDGAVPENHEAINFFNEGQMGGMVSDRTLELIKNSKASLNFTANRSGNTITISNDTRQPKDSLGRTKIPFKMPGTTLTYEASSFGGPLLASTFPDDLKIIPADHFAPYRSPVYMTDTGNLGYYMYAIAAYSNPNIVEPPEEKFIVWGGSRTTHNPEFSTFSFSEPKPINRFMFRLSPPRVTYNTFNLNMRVEYATDDNLNFISLGTVSYVISGIHSRLCILPLDLSVPIKHLRFFVNHNGTTNSSQRSYITMSEVMLGTTTELQESQEFVPTYGIGVFSVDNTQAYATDKTGKFPNAGKTPTVLLNMGPNSSDLSLTDSVFDDSSYKIPYLGRDIILSLT